MAKKKHKTTKKTHLQSSLAEFLSRAEDLFLEHEKQIRKILDGAEDNSIVVNFTMLIDESEGSQKLETKIRFSETFSYRQVCQVDPDQGKFTEVDEAAKAASRTAKTKARASKEKTVEQLKTVNGESDAPKE